MEMIFRLDQSIRHLPLAQDTRNRGIPTGLLFWRELGAMDDVDSEAYLDESEEPLFADDLDDDDDIPAPPSPINEEEIRHRVRLQEASNSSRAGDNSLAFGFTSVPWPDEQGGETSTAVANPDLTEQPVPIKKRKPVLTLGPDRLAFVVAICVLLLQCDCVVLSSAVTPVVVVVVVVIYVVFAMFFCCCCSLLWLLVLLQCHCGNVSPQADGREGI